MRTSDLKICLKQATIILEESFPCKILNQLVTVPSDSPSEEHSPSSPRKSELLDEINLILQQGSVEKVVTPGRQRKKRPTIEMYSSSEDWWESKGLMPGLYISC